MARDKLAEIAAVRLRGKGLGYSRGRSELDALVEARGGVAISVPPQYVIIRLVTILEVCSRDWAAQIIDAGEPFIGRGIELVKGSLKIDFAVARALVGKHVSFGELVSHDLPVNGIGDIDRIFSQLLGVPLFAHLASVTDRWEIMAEGQPPSPLLPEPDHVRAVLARLFEVRHIFVHELPIDGRVGEAELQSYIRAAHQFVEAADEAFTTLIHGDYPITQLGMNEQAAERATSAENELRGVLEALDPDSADHELQASQEAWLSYRERQAEFRSGINRPGHGSIAPMLYSSEIAKITQARTEQLRWYLEREEGDM